VVGKKHSGFLKAQSILFVKDTGLFVGIAVSVLRRSDPEQTLSFPPWLERTPVRL